VWVLRNARRGFRNQLALLIDGMFLRADDAHASIQREIMESRWFSSYSATCREALNFPAFFVLGAAALNQLEQDAGISNNGNKNGHER